MGGASAWKKRPSWRSQTGPESSWELRNLCFVCQPLEQGADLATATLRPKKPGAANTAGTQVQFTSSGASKLKAVSGGQHSSEWVEAKLCLAPEGHTNLRPATAPAVTLESKSAHPDSCSGGSTLGLNDNSSAPTSSPCDALCPELLDPLCQLPADEEDNPRASQGAGTPGGELELGARDPTRTWALSTVEEQEEGEEQREEEEECPICTEPYGPGEHYLALLNCGHNLCVGCLHQLLGMTPRADPGRVCCPLCRQKTPMLEWEICQLQEELLQADGPQRPVPTAPATPLRPGPGPWGSLEHRYQLRFLAGPVGGRSCLPFLPCPPSLGIWLWTLRERGPCARRLSLLSLLALELLGLVLIFMPLMLLGVLLMLLDRSSH